MAKWGEGDPRWIVEERPDATNVNNWHWTEKNGSTWSKEKLKSLLEELVIEDPNIGRCKIVEVSSIDGEAVANNRKGKLIFFYEWVIKCAWTGNLNGDSEDVKGKLEIPNLSEENSADEITIDITLDSESSSKSDCLKEMMRTKGLELVRQQMKQYINALRDEFAKDMIKPRKLTEGGSINSFQTAAQLNKKPTVSAVPSVNLETATKATPNSTGVKIEFASITLMDSFKCTAEELYRVFTDPTLLQAFTQAKATSDLVVGGQFSLLNENIIGKYTGLEANKCIMQSWRNKSWPTEHFSEVTITFDQTDDCTRLTLVQTRVPKTDLERTEEGWKRYYFESIKRTFGFGASIF